MPTSYIKLLARAKIDEKRAFDLMILRGPTVSIDYENVLMILDNAYRYLKRNGRMLISVQEKDEIETIKKLVEKFKDELIIDVKLETKTNFEKRYNWNSDRYIIVTAGV